MKNRYLAVPVALFAPAVWGGTWVTEADFELAVANHRIVTNAHVDTTGEEISNARVFVYNFGEDAADPYYLNDPGFAAEPGSGLPQGAQLNFSVLDGLRFWDGAGAVSFGITPGSEFIRINRAFTDLDVYADSSPMPGFAIANISAGGSMHAHLNSFLKTSNEVEPAAGIYFLPMDLGVTSSGIARSLPAYVAFNNGLTQGVMETAADYLANPLPGDANLDGRVNTLDFNELAGNFGMTNPYFFNGDFDENGALDSIDFTTLVSNFGRSNEVPLTMTVIPEPACLLVVLPWMMLRRRR